MKQKFDCNNIVVGKHDPLNKMVTRVYFSDTQYAIYDVADSTQLHYLTEDVKCDASEIAFEIESIRSRIANPEKILAVKGRFAKAYKECFEGHLDKAKEILKSIEKSLIEEIKNAYKFRYTYILTASAVVILNFIIMIWGLGFSLALTGTTSDLYYVASFGSLGGLISISLALKKAKDEIFTKFDIYIVDALFRMFIAMCSAVIVYFMVNGNIVFGFINGLTDNKDEVMFLFSILAGFSEVFIIKALGKLEDKANKKE